MKAHIVSIGDELLIGQVVNTNAAAIGQMMTGIGLDVSEIVSIPDTTEAIHRALRSAFTRADVIIMSGGLGPTNDDRTTDALASFFNVPLIFSEHTWTRLQKLFARFERVPTDSHRQQCHVPQNAELLDNNKGTAPGMYFNYQNKHLFVLPGVPYEMDYLMSAHVLPRLIEIHGAGSMTLISTLCTVGEGESRLAAAIADIEDNLPEHLTIAYLPNPGRVRIRLISTGFDARIAQQALDRTKVQIIERIREFVYAEEDISLSEAIGRLLLSRDMYLAVAESCTGGFLGHQITSVAGSSAYFQGGVISYSNDVKEDLLGVAHQTLHQHGAVSEQTAIEMAAGARRRFGAEVALSVTGVAGPGGGSEEKPVGTVWIGLATSEGTSAQKFQFGKDRARNIELSAVNALNMLRKYLTQA